MKQRKLSILFMVLACVVSIMLLVGCTGGTSGSGSNTTDNSDTASGAGGTTTTTQSNSNASTKVTKLIVGFDQDFPPYGYIGNDGKFTGFDLDCAKEVCKRLGWEVEYKPINWDAKDLELSSGAIDCIWNGFTIEGRESDYTFTEPYMDNSQVIVVRKDSGITTLDDLKDKIVMAQADSAALHLLEPGGDQEELAKTFKKVQTVPDYNSAFLELESGSVDAVAMDLPVAKFQIAGKEALFTILEKDQLSSEHYGVGFLKGNLELRDQVQKTLKEMFADGTIKTICQKYSDQGISYDMWILIP
ncbi:MAG: amino acid ABC transporter substrate-binding protein [Coriobacteriales bacterium]|jgi:polar amino acid transport system substrate-binding protein|nr:amino acid ABC transporter substrate-binding protein [Coriobacteriales bacterium]